MPRAKQQQQQQKTGDAAVSDSNEADPTASQDAPASAEASAPGESAPDALVTVVRTERHYGATDAFGYHLEIPGGHIEVEYLSDGSVRSADGAHPLDAAVFVRTVQAAEE